MGTNETFWTTDRLRELNRLWKTMTIHQLERHFSKTGHDIEQAYHFHQQHKRLLISSKRTRRYKVTIYAPVHDGRHLTGTRYHGDYIDL